MAEFSPMMQKYLETKEEYKDCVLFYRLGDFYEMFFDDAVMVSKELELTLTGKECGQEERAPMCGVPYHAADTYINRLVANGHKVAICEQVEDPKLAKGLVKREVIRIVTPGTNFSMDALEEGVNSYLMCIISTGKQIGIATVDITTGSFLVTECENASQLLDEINKFIPNEIIVNESLSLNAMGVSELIERLNIPCSKLDGWYYETAGAQKILREHFRVSNLEGLGLKDYPTGVIAAGALLNYLYETQKNSLPHLTSITPYSTGLYMIIDSSTRRNLEITETMREKNKRGSLLWVLDRTKTAMGARLLRNMLQQPLISIDEINRRQDAIEELSSRFIDREDIREALAPIYDLERLIGRISTKSAGPRELIAFKNSIKMLPVIKSLLATMGSPLIRDICDEIDTLDDVYELIEHSIVDEPPLTIKEGGIIKAGFNEEVDKLRSAKTEGKRWLSELEETEKDRTGIKGLKVKYNKVFGYYLEVTNSYKDLVPEDYIRKQTLTNAERYTTPKLKELEEVILGAEDKLFSLEYNIFTDIRDKVAMEVVRIQQSAAAIAGIDVYTDLSVVAEQNKYVRPKINDKGVIRITCGRHPVVEKMLSSGIFVENDTYLDNEDKRVSIITGPNMAGKSTYMRQVALITLMAQIGSFVPAKEADICICDRIFTRVGASDDLSSGQSTFMVEMTEVANILRNATKNSLLILDEIGRGTSTFDGLSIAWAVIEHIANPELLGAKALFATHYHELTELEGKLPAVNNYCIAVKEQGDEIVFLRKIIKGGADKSYGIQVARLAGVPASVLSRASDIARQLSDNDIAVKAREIASNAPGLPVSDNMAQVPFNKKNNPNGFTQISLFDSFNAMNSKEQKIVDDIKALDISSLTPLEALNKLDEYKKQL